MNKRIWASPTDGRVACPCNPKQTDLFEIANPPAGANHPDTSHAAAESMKPVAQPLRQKVFSMIAGMPDGATCEQVEQHLCLKSGCASARINELVTKFGMIEDSGQRRTTTSGRSAIVWVEV